jgi:hypothetical protein
LTRKEQSDEPGRAHPGWANRLLWFVLLWTAAVMVLALIGGLVRFVLSA